MNGAIDRTLLKVGVAIAALDISFHLVAVKFATDLTSVSISPFCISSSSFNSATNTHVTTGNDTPTAINNDIDATTADKASVKNTNNTAATTSPTNITDITTNASTNASTITTTAVNTTVDYPTTMNNVTTTNKTTTTAPALTATLSTTAAPLVQGQALVAAEETSPPSGVDTDAATVAPSKA